MTRTNVYPPSVKPGIPVLGKKPEGWIETSFGAVLKPVLRKVKLMENQEYQLVLAKRNRGGVAPRSRLKGSEIKTQTQFFIRKNDFLISRRQIIHGACGVVPAELDGAIVSNEYSALLVQDGLLLNYLRYFCHTIYFQQTCFQSSVGVDVEKMVFKIEKWFKWPIYLPPVLEQQKIAAILSTWDEAIALTERLIAALQARKKGLMQRLLSGEMRLLGCEDEPKDTTLKTAKKQSQGKLPLNWNYTFLGEVTYESRDRAAQTGKSHLPVVGVNNINGLDTNPKYFADDLSRYKVIKPGMFAYNPMRLNIGSIGYCTPKIGEGLVSPDYVVFGCNSEKVDSDFLYYCTQSDDWKSWTNKAGAGSVRIRIYYKELSQYLIMLPSLAEQRKITAVLSTADEEISLRKQYLEKLQQQKKGLMQRLLTGEIRVAG